MTKEDITNHNILIYKKIYDNLIESRLFRGRKKVKNDGFNKHHIIPKCMGGKDEENNYVLLTSREHIIAHMLLHRIYPNNSSLSYACLRMIQSSEKDPNQKTFKTRELSELKDKSVEFLRKANIGRSLSSETKQKLSKSHVGKKASTKTKELLSSIRKGHKTSISTKEKISKSNSGKPKSKEHINKMLESRSGLYIKNGRRIIDSGNNIFDSIKACSRYYGIKESRLTTYLKLGQRGFRYLDPPVNVRRKIEGPDGTIYDNSKLAAKAAGVISVNTIKRWIKLYPEKGWKFID